MIIESIEKHSNSTPLKTALVFEGIRSTYRELDDEAAALSADLRRLGLRAGDVVALAMDATPELIVSLLSVLKAGAIYFCLDRKFSPERKQALLAASNARFLLELDDVPRGTPARGITAIRATALFDRPVGTGISGAEDGRATEWCSIYCTSGSTGVPKAVLGSSHSIANRLRWLDRIAPFHDGDVAYLRASLNVVMSGWEIFSPLMAGATLFLPRPGDASNPSRILENVRAHGITHLGLVPTLAQVLLKEDRADFECLKQLRLLEIGGEHSPPGLLKTYAAILDRTTLVHRYGSTEHPAVICHPVRPGEPIGDGVAAGRPIDHVTARILDESLQEVPDGRTGMLYIGGAGLAAGYANNAEMTARHFIPNPWPARPGDRLYCTGDLARKTVDGEFEILGRQDFTIKIFGYRIEPREIELALLRHPGIVEAVVVKSDDARARDDLVAYVVLSAGTPLESPVLLEDDGLKAHLAAHLPGHMVPRIIVRLPKMPLIASGKIDRAALRGQTVPIGGPAAHAMPKSDDTEVLGLIWCMALGTAQWAPDDNFIHLGGDSISAVRIVTRIRDLLGLRISVRLLFDFPDFDDFSREVFATRRHKQAPAPQVEPTSAAR